MTDKTEFGNLGDMLGGSGGNDGEHLDLDSLFASARSDQPDLRDDNFTKIVSNSLPSKPVRRRSRGISFDVIGVAIGLYFAYLFFDVNRVISGLVNLIPESITLSPVHALIAVATVSLMSIAAWWTVENNRN